MSFEKVGITYNNIFYDYYFEIGGGYGDIILSFIASGLLYFIEHELATNMLVFLWAPDNNISELLTKYNKNITVVIITFKDYPVHPFDNEDIRRKLNMISKQDSKFTNFINNLSDNYHKYNIDKKLRNPDGTYYYKNGHKFNIAKNEQINIPMASDETYIFNQLTKTKYVIIHYMAGTLDRCLPLTLVQSMIDTLIQKYNVILIGDTNSTRFNYHSNKFIKNGKIVCELHDMINKCSINLTYNLIKKASLIITSFSSAYIMAMICNTKTLVVIPDNIILHYRKNEIIDPNHAFNIKYYLYGGNCDTLICNGNNYDNMNLIDHNVKYCKWNDYKLEYKIITKVNNQSAINNVLKYVI